LSTSAGQAQGGYFTVYPATLPRNDVPGHRSELLSCCARSTVADEHEPGAAALAGCLRRLCRGLHCRHVVSRPAVCAARVISAACIGLTCVGHGICKPNAGAGKPPRLLQFRYVIRVMDSLLAAY
jgi:hypothetical protein